MDDEKTVYLTRAEHLVRQGDLDRLYRENRRLRTRLVWQVVDRQSELERQIVALEAENKQLRRMLGCSLSRGELAPDTDADPGGHA